MKQDMLGLLLNACRDFFRSATAILHESLNQGRDLLLACFDIFGIVSFATLNSALLKLSIELVDFLIFS